METGKKTIAILYIATGPYISFWEKFYQTFEKFFLKKTEKHYFVFTDSIDVLYNNNSRVHIIYQNSEPWPLPTLLKFHRFLEIEDELKKFDYIYQSNANIICVKEVEESNFLPRKEYKEELFFTLHPGFYNKKKYEYPYDRNKNSQAYVPYNCGNVYVFGAMNGGFSNAYLSYIRRLDNDIIEDLKKGIIAKWHDESYVNRSIILLNNYRLLPMSYCYPVGFDVPGECIITGVRKDTVFNVNKFKGCYPDDSKDIKCKIFRYAKNRLMKKKEVIHFFIDILFWKKV